MSAHRHVTGAAVREAFLATVRAHGAPASTLTDNGLVFTTRLAGGKGGRNAFETELRRLGVLQKNSRPNHPTTCGKIERLHQTLKRWLAAQRRQPSTLSGLQRQLDRFVEDYNARRPHSSLRPPQPPLEAYVARPKATPGDRDGDVHLRVRHDRVDRGGKVTLRIDGQLHSIGVGQAPRVHASCCSCGILRSEWSQRRPGSCSGSSRSTCRGATTARASPRDRHPRTGGESQVRAFPMS